MKLVTHQKDLPWAEPEGFALITDTTTDGDRIAAALAKQAADREAAGKQQLTLHEPH